MQYRSEIDGLRAVAVLPVIFFHAGFSVFSGGYVGVDVFFVISGYLITSILIADLDRGNFSILRFYERRARRILPALFAVMFACLPFAYMWMLPSELEDFAQSLIATVFFASNMLFWLESGYFGAAAELKPLLHTWSLAVEEQYYLTFPVFLFLAWRFGRGRVFWSIFAIAVVSLALSEWGWRNAPVANFYFAPTRAWELLTGSMCAFLNFGQKQRSSNALSAIGIALILFSVFFYDESTPFPSSYALAPVIGTALIILFAEKSTWTARLLSTRAFVGLGLISYSAYLWHQPLFAFARLRSINEPGPLLMTALALFALMLAWATWSWVEQPFRKRDKPALSTQRSVFAASGAVGAAFLCLGIAGHAGSGFDWRLNNEVLRFAIADSDRAQSECNFNTMQAINTTLNHPQTQCITSRPEDTEVMLIGDSHMWALADGLREALLAAEIENYFISHTSCLPLNGFHFFDAGRRQDCEEFLTDAFSWAKEAGISTIVISARFPLYLNGDRFKNGEGGVETGNPSWVDLANQTASNWDDNERRSRVLSEYEQRIRELSQEFNVVLIYPIPEAGWNVPSYAAKVAHLTEGNGRVTTSYDAYKKRSEEVNALFDLLVSELPNVHAAKVHEVLCDESAGRCINADETAVYYYDDDHLSNAGARFVAPTIIEAIEEALNRGKR